MLNRLRRRLRQRVGRRLGVPGGSVWPGKARRERVAADADFRCRGLRW